MSLRRDVASACAARRRERAHSLIEMFTHEAGGRLDFAVFDCGEQFTMFTRESGYRIVRRSQLGETEPDFVAQKIVKMGDVAAAARLDKGEMEVEIGVDDFVPLRLIAKVFEPPQRRVGEGRTGVTLRQSTHDLQLQHRANAVQVANFLFTQPRHKGASIGFAAEQAAERELLNRRPNRRTREAVLIRQLHFGKRRIWRQLATEDAIAQRLGQGFDDRDRLDLQFAHVGSGARRVRSARFIVAEIDC